MNSEIGFIIWNLLSLVGLGFLLGNFGGCDRKNPTGGIAAYRYKLDSYDNKYRYFYIEDAYEEAIKNKLKCEVIEELLQKSWRELSTLKKDHDLLNNRLRKEGLL